MNFPGASWMFDILKSNRVVDMAELIFVVDGDAGACQVAQRTLEQAGYSVRTFSTLVAAEESQRSRPSLMLIDATLSDGSGADLCRQIRRNPVYTGAAVVLLTAGSDEEQSCAALEAGADNYLAKPFSPRELMARVQAALRYAIRPFPVGPADIVIDHGSMKLSVRGSEVVATSLEFRVLDYLARHRGHVLTRDVLLDAVWGERHFVNPRTVDACIRRLREKIEPNVTSPIYLKTVRGIGYRFDGVAVWPSSGEDCNCFVCAPSNGRATHPAALKLLNRTAAS